MSAAEYTGLSSNDTKFGDTVYLLRLTNQLRLLYTYIRDVNTSNKNFIFYNNRLIRLLIEETLNLLPLKSQQIITPLNELYQGFEPLVKNTNIVGVSIIRAGESMEFEMRNVLPDCKIGKILIQRNEETFQPQLFYSKFPEYNEQDYIFLLDPMLATGGSVLMAIDCLIKNGYKEDKIIFVNIISCPEGIEIVKAKHPSLKIVTGMIDECLNEKKYIVPGLGDFGDRYFT
ncbi:PRTase-like protein [Hanseniaspora valbyensis NRRL Y-1626]|uniref:uracil phosphoribosyltransferase n=1 Tax=Hanseniaspora valbyensis NRRL Y-1626 TaxID=766949 RepID=A0A1B7TBS8_9ASCO|nr:PRTase-like protein [Hanseniaspora valbyensis NRRL Y-1626]